MDTDSRSVRACAEGREQAWRGQWRGKETYVIFSRIKNFYNDGKFSCSVGGSIFLGWKEDRPYILSNGRNVEGSANVEEPSREEKSGFCKGSGAFHGLCFPAGLLQAPTVLTTRARATSGRCSSSHLRQDTQPASLWLGRPRAALPPPLRLVSLRTSGCSPLSSSSCCPSSCQLSNVAQRTHD